MNKILTRVYCMSSVTYTYSFDSRHAGKVIKIFLNIQIALEFFFVHVFIFAHDIQ